MRYQVILFDLDGTLLDTLGDLTASVNAVLRRRGRPERTEDEVRRFVGNGSEMLIRRALPEGCGDDEVQDILREYLAYYAAHCQERTRPYDGVLPMLRALRAEGRRLAVVTNKPDDAAQILVRHHFGDLIETTVGLAPTRRRKPAPDMPEEALAALGAAKETAVYVGDSETDVRVAENAELPEIAVSWGFRTREQLLAAGAETIAESAAELLTLLRQDEKPKTAEQ